MLIIFNLSKQLIGYVWRYKMKKQLLQIAGLKLKAINGFDVMHLLFQWGSAGP